MPAAFLRAGGKYAQGLVDSQLPEPNRGLGAQGQSGQSVATEEDTGWQLCQPERAAFGAFLGLTQACQPGKIGSGRQPLDHGHGSGQLGVAAVEHLLQLPQAAGFEADTRLLPEQKGLPCDLGFGPDRP